MEKTRNTEMTMVEQCSEERFYHRNMAVLSRMVKEEDAVAAEGIERRSLPHASSEEEGAHMRDVLVEWLKHINQYRKSKPGVVVLSVEIIDRYVYSLSCKVSEREVNSLNYQCIGAAAYFMSSKLEEVSPITAQEISKYTSECCSISDIMDMEVVIAFQLNFNLKFLTSIDFIYFLTNFIDMSHSRKTSLLNFAVDLYLNILNECNLKKYASHIIAMNSIILGYYELEDFTEHELKEVVKTLIDLLNPEKIQLRGCYDFISNVIDAKRINSCNDADDSTDTLQSF